MSKRIVRAFLSACLAAVAAPCVLAGPVRAEALDFPWSLAPADVNGSFTFLDAPGVGQSLATCALGATHPGRAAACVRVAVTIAPEKASLHRLLRRVIREGASPEGIAEAAAAMAATPERDSADLMLWALLEGRGGDVAAPHLIDAFLAPNPPWPGHYLRFAASHAPGAVARGLAAERVITRGLLKTRDLPDLVQVLTSMPADHPDAARLADLATHLRGVCDLEAIAAAKASGRLNSLPIGIRCRGGVTPAPPTPATSANIACGQGFAFGPLSRDGLRRAAVACADVIEPRDFHRQTASGRRFPPMRSAASVASAQPGDDLGRPWLRRPPRAPGDTPALPAGSYDPKRFPPDFWGYDPLLKQPSWYPRHIHITIDDGPRPQYLIPALDVLDRHGVRVTFFFVGAALVRRHLEDAEGLRRILDRVLASGHGIGYHSMNHDTWPDIHESEREPDQFADSVTLYRWILRRLTDRAIPVVHGRFPGGRGAFLEAMPRLYAEAGLLQHVFWTFGPGYWVQHTPTGVVKGMACELARAPEPVTILLHEFPMMAMHFEGFLQTIRTQCPADGTPTIPEIRTVWRKDDVFAPTLCNSNHGDLRRLCERPTGTAARPVANARPRSVGQRVAPVPGRGSGGAQGQPLGPAR